MRCFRFPRPFPSQGERPVNQQIANSLSAAEDAVTSLIEECKKDGPLYRQSPKAAAQASGCSTPSPRSGRS